MSGKVITEKGTYDQAHNINIRHQFTACIWDCLPQYSIGSLLVVFDKLHLQGTTCRKYHISIRVQQAENIVEYLLLVITNWGKFVVFIKLAWAWI